MKSYLCIFYLLVYFVAFPQQGTSAIVEYKQINNTYNVNSYDCTLFIDSATTIFLPRYLNTKVVANENKDDKPKEIYPDWEYLKIDHAQKQILFFDSFGPNNFLIKDDYNDLKWIITGDVKAIAGYQCIKATTSFRGVNWVAWFAPQIELAYGPWKLHGLPGLIMEASDATNKYTWRFKKIEYKRNDIFDRDFKTLAETKNKEPWSLKEFLENQQEWSDNNVARERQKDPDAIIYVAPIRGDHEEKYEWEE